MMGQEREENKNIKAIKGKKERRKKIMFVNKITTSLLYY